ncbi:hypothetical protein FJZ33_07740 [Candidatus Poribacteria bacterium]|nr:hypothetical protein [Candidatus Poribacteria bacterium]
MKGINDSLEELKKIAALTHTLRLDKIHLNTVVRPPAEKFAQAVTAEEMKEIITLFDERAEIIAEIDKPVVDTLQHKNMEGEILSLLKRRPCTIEDISNSLGIHRNEAIKYVEKLMISGSIGRVKQGEKWFYEKMSEI